MGLLPKMPDTEEGPPLMMSATGEEEEEPTIKDTIHGWTVPSSSLNSNDAASSFVDRYEHMVQTQAGEYAAVWQHMRPCLERLQELIQQTTNHQPSKQTSNTSEQIWQQSIRLTDLKAIFPQLANSASSSNITSKEPWTSDRQLMLVLQVLAEESSNSNSHNKEKNISLTWAEVVQCYKACIGGMQTLERLPGPSEERVRCRQRTMAMLALFASASSSKTTAASTISSPLLTVNEESMQSRSILLSKTSSQSKSKLLPVFGALTLLMVALAVGASLSSHHENFLNTSSPSSSHQSIPSPSVVPHGSSIVEERSVADESMPFAAPKQSITSSKPWLQPKSRVIGTATITSRNSANLHEQAAQPASSSKSSSSSSAPSELTTQPLDPLFHDTLVGGLLGGPAMALLAQAYQAGAWAAVGSTVIFGAGIISLASAVVQFLRQRLSARGGNRQ